MTKLNYSNDEICKACQGACCKHYAGCCMPEDFETINVSILKDLLLSGKWAIDGWDGDPRDGMSILDEAYFIRPAHTNAIGKVMDFSTGGICVNLTPTGCSLSNDERPAGCRFLEPGINECIPKGATSRDAAIAWLPYTHIILEAVRLAEETKRNKDG